MGEREKTQRDADLSASGRVLIVMHKKRSTGPFFSVFPEGPRFSASSESSEPSGRSAFSPPVTFLLLGDQVSMRFPPA